MVFNSHAGHNPDGKVGCGAIGLIKESTENRRVNAELIRQLRALNHTVYDCTVDDGTSSSNVLSKIVAKCNAHAVDWDISIHFNSGAADNSGNNKTTGIEVLIYNLNDTATKNKANAICNELSALGFKNRGVKQRQDLYVLRKTNAKAMLIECCFVDDADDVRLYQSLGVTRFAAAIVKGLTGQVLQESTTATTTNTSAKTYDVVKEINKYTTSADAIAQTNAKGKLAIGTYYVYDKYPDGYKGVYNITTDKTGDSAGSWINPKENIVQQTTTTTTEKKLYRVRKSKDDAKSQIGAYSSLDNAKAACQAAGADYHVFDWEYKIVYSYIAPVEPKPVEPAPVQPEPTPVVPEPAPEVVEVKVYDLAYPEKNLICDRDVNRTNTDCAKAVKKILQNNANFNYDIAKAFFKLAPIYKIDPMMAIAQSILETGWFKFEGSSAKPEQNNFCGLGVTGGGVSGAIFNTIEDGVKAQLQHLYAYGCKDELPSSEKTLLDPRFHLVTRGIAPHWQQLAGRWAVPGYDKNAYSTPEAAMKAGNTYGQKIRNIYNQLIAIAVTDEDIKAIFGEDNVKPEAPIQPVQPTDQVPPTNPVKPVEPTKPVKTNYNKIVSLFIEFIKKLVEFFITYLSKKDI